MSDNPIPEVEPDQNPNEGNLTEELGSLGMNIVGVLRAAWERPERQKLQQEIEDGLADLGSTLRKEAKAVSDSPVTQRVKTEVEGLGNRVRSGQVEAKVRSELVGALHIVNTELQKVANILASSANEADETPAETPAAETTAGGETFVETAQAAPVETPPSADETAGNHGAAETESPVIETPPESSAPTKGA